jgi:tRNA threonylcarbamoyladenosine biosynthesis protein TsaB
MGVSSLEAAVPETERGTVLACLAAQRRPPGQTWWVQRLTNAEGASDVSEVPLSDLTAMLERFRGPVFMDNSGALGPLDASLDLRALTPSAVIVAEKAGRLDPARHPPAPVYARAPDAALPSGET